LLSYPSLPSATASLSFGAGGGRRAAGGDPATAPDRSQQKGHVEFVGYTGMIRLLFGAMSPRPLPPELVLLVLVLLLVPPPPPLSPQAL
jgi:hypothetical protein